MGGGVIAAIWRGWRDPRGAMARQMASGLGEPRALAHLMLACGLFFVASLPGAMRQADRLDIAAPLEGVVAAHLFAYGALAPLAFYGLAAVMHLAALAFGGRGGFLGARAALFWALLLGAPLALAVALVGVVAERQAGAPGALATWAWYAAFGFWLWLLAASLAEAEGFRGTGRVAAVLAAGFGAVAGGLGLLVGGGAAAG